MVYNIIYYFINQLWQHSFFLSRRAIFCISFEILHDTSYFITFKKILYLYFIND